MKRSHIHTFAQRSIAFALAGTLAVSACLVPTAARATSSDEIQQQLAVAQAELGELEATLAQAEANLGKTNYDLEQTRSQISDLEVRIGDNEDKLVVARENLSAIIEQSYKQGGEPGLLELLLSSESFDDLVSRLHYVTKISQAKQEAIQTVSDLQDSLEKDKVSLQKNEKEQESLLESQKSQQEMAEAAAASQAAYVNGLSDELVAAMEAERAAAAEASLRAAEEAARKEAEEQAAREKAEQEAKAQEEANRAQQRQEAEEQEDEEQEEATETRQTTPTQTTTTNHNNDTADSDNETTTTPTTTVSNTTPSTPSNASGSVRQAAVNAALSQVGVNYGHTNSPGVNWDCSGLTSWAWGQAGVSLTPSSGTYSYGQFQIIRNSGHWTTDAGSLQIGDCVFYSNDGGNTCYHVAMYIGGGSVVHAIDYSHGVQVTGLYFCHGFCGGGAPI